VTPHLGCHVSVNLVKIDIKDHGLTTSNNQIVDDVTSRYHPI